MKYVKRIFIVLVLTFVIPSIVLASYIGVISIIDDEPYTNTAADTLRNIFGQEFVIYLEERMYIINDWYNRKIHDEEVVIAPKKEKKHKITPIKNIKKKKNTKRKPDNIQPLILKPKLKDEGIWKAVKGYDGIMYTTKFRADPKRHWSISEMCKIDLNRIELHWISGSKYKDKNGNYGKGILELDPKKELIAAFNGAFKPIHDKGGMWKDGKELIELKTGLATLVVYQNGEVDIFKYTKEKQKEIDKKKKKIRYARQNHPPILEKGAINNKLKNWGIVLVQRKAGPDYMAELINRGITPGGSNNIDRWLSGKGGVYVYSESSKPIYAWRSGAGITKDNWLVYVAANDITAQKMAYSLQNAGCTDGIHLDMNINHLIFNFYRKKNDKFEPESLSERFYQDLRFKYQTGYKQDFFYVLKKSKK